MTTPDVLDGAEIERIVAGLSEAMRCALMWPKEIGGNVRIVPSTLYAATITGLERRQLIDWQGYLGPLGIAVRAHLARTVRPLVDGGSDADPS